MIKKPLIAGASDDEIRIFHSGTLAGGYAIHLVASTPSTKIAHGPDHNIEENENNE